MTTLSFYHSARLRARFALREQVARERGAFRRASRGI